MNMWKLLICLLKMNKDGSNSVSVYFLLPVPKPYKIQTLASVCILRSVRYSQKLHGEVKI